MVDSMATGAAVGRPGKSKGAVRVACEIWNMGGTIGAAVPSGIALASRSPDSGVSGCSARRHLDIAMVEAFAPPIAFVAGVLVPLVWLRDELVFTESLLFMGLVVVAGIVSGPIGLALVSGYVLGDLFFGSTPHFTPNLAALQPLLTILSRVVPGLLLVLLAMVIPRTARLLAAPFPARTGEKSWWPAVAFGAALAVLVYLWSQATTVLIRPAFTWLDHSPEVDAIAPVQFGWPWLAVAAAAAGVARIRLEGLALEHHPRLQEAVTASARWQSRRRPSWRDRLPVPARISLVAVGLTLLLAGTYEHFLDAVTVAVVIGSLEAWRLGLFGDRARTIVERMRRAPFLMRAALTLGLGYGVSWWLAKVLWSADSLRVTALGAIITLAFAYLLVVPLDQEPRPT